MLAMGAQLHPISRGSATLPMGHSIRRSRLDRSVSARLVAGKAARKPLPGTATRAPGQWIESFSPGEVQCP